ncbi:MAG: alpha/beta hydrolase fold domain-containing protein [Candidatus Pseudobacter hemicellulosilyticus]|uniref:Alpha/beta hydrolase fold domain-containing protein n=1 Tax=Candidatus Pseudobacter hemicellulosilyticus TaxID=3121375 RepID=A0AAJ5WUD4_9BACT|nr:MAG: alpha/beta hydrolase fold domain-containing protein [Pseudobacter sp.]
MKNWILLLCLACTLQASAQQAYQTDKDIAYYADSVSRKDAYIASQCKLDCYYPKGKTGYATIVWFHGGGLTGGNKHIPEYLTGKGYAVIAVGYRFSPRAKAPAYIEDAAAAVAWVFKNISRFGGDPAKIFVTGHSAGGYLGMMIGLDKKYLKKYAIDADSIAGLIPFSGQAITHFTIRQERGIPEKQPTIDEYAPLYHVRADAPPMLLITGDRELELLGRYEENAYLARMMKLAGHKRTRLLELDGFDHGTMVEPSLPLLLREINTILQQRSGKK